MRTTRSLLRAPLALLAVAPIACIASTSNEGTDTNSSSIGCPEYQVGATFDSSTDVDPSVLAFMQAAADLGSVSASLQTAVQTACAGVATDLGDMDTWSSLDADDAISNSNGTGACDVARAHMVSIMKANVSANFALVVSRGACYPDFTSETTCEQQCHPETTCNLGTVETRCTPAYLNVQCGGTCNESSYCEGTVTTQTQCQGSCEAQCAGSCTGTCIDESGNRTQNNASCQGKCDGHCSGQCTGRCKIDVSTGVQCGSSATCTGGCTGSYTSPRCETEFSDPMCMTNESCIESCRTQIVSQAKCDPDTVELLANVSVSADVATLVTSINKNLPPLLQTADAQGRIAVDVLTDLAASGQAVLANAGNLDLHSVACATAAAQSLASTTTDLNVTVQASAGAESDCSSNAQ